MIFCLFRSHVPNNSQVTVPSWIFRVTDSSELVKMNLESFELQSVIGICMQYINLIEP